MARFTGVSWHQNQNQNLHQNQNQNPHLHPHPLKAQGGCEVPLRRIHMACDSAVLRWIAAQVRMIQKRVAFLETALDTDAGASEPQTPMGSGDTTSRESSPWKRLSIKWKWSSRVWSRRWRDMIRLVWKPLCRFFCTGVLVSSSRLGELQSASTQGTSGCGALPRSTRGHSC